MPTSKISRAAPSRRFENYVLLKISSPEFGLADVNDRFMSTIIGGNVNEQTSDIQNIGFDFIFDGVVYKRFVADSNGWMALVDPTETLAANVVTALFNGGYSAYQNDAINLSNSTQNVLICPWHDDLITVSRDVNSTPIALGTEKSRRITEGLETPPILYNQTQFGVKMFNDTSKLLGRRLIVRWSCLTNTGAMNTNLRFDVIIYENGRIEFRYAPRLNLTLRDVKDNGYYVEGATIGIFMSGTNRFRDFSPGLGQNDFQRLTSEYGGAVYNDTFVDASFDIATSGTLNIPYNWSLRPQAHWPGLNTEGTAFVFLPPVNKRKILPRIQQRMFDNQSSLPSVFNTGNGHNRSKKIQTLFDDRKTILYAGYGSGSYGSGTLVNYPSTLQRFYAGNHPSAINRQTLFAGDFNVTSSTSKIASDEFLYNDYQTTINPWKEDKIFDNAPNSSIDPFFSASNVEALGLGLSDHLRSKTQIKLSMPINFATNMFAISSSIYYYNRKVKCWQIPENSTSPIEVGASSVSPNSKGDLSSPGIDTIRSSLPEDHRGFNAIGTSLASGSIERLGLSATHTDPSIGALYSQENIRSALNKEYRKSISNNENYKASSNEVFNLPIYHPFILEKAIIEIPFAIGDNWFRDKTTCIIPHETGAVVRSSYDFGGPGITISLWNQHKIGQFTRRDLIMSGTITHFDDNTSNIVFSSHPPYDHTCQIRPVGFKSFNGKPAAVITPLTASDGISLEFIGPVASKLTAMTSNGVSVLIQRLMLNADKDLNRSGVFDLFNSEKIQLKNESAVNFSQLIFSLYVNNFCRGGTGFDPSGRSIYGKEISSAQIVDKDNNVPNQFFLNKKGLSFDNLSPAFESINKIQFGESILSGSDFISLSVVSLEDQQISPYLLYPEDELIIAISKTRPAFYGTSTPSPHTSGSVIHDVVLMTGSINMTLFGSLLREGKEYHNTTSDILNTPAIYETIIGNDPVLDQFEVEYIETYSSGTYDDYIAGALLKKSVSSDGKVILVPDRGRGRIFSKNSARYAPIPGAVDYDYVDLYSKTLTRYVDKVGNIRLNPINDEKERYWDSLMPAIDKCFEANGVGICIQTLSSIPMGDPGFIYFNTPATTNSITVGLMLLNDLNWTFSYPYEARYSASPRQVIFEKSFIATRIYDVISATPYYQITPTYLKNFTAIIPMPRYSLNGGNSITVCVPNPSPNSPITTNSAWAGIPRDLDLLATSTKNLISKEDVTKLLFGFGDLNTVYYDLNSGLRGGTNHFADFRKVTQLSLGSNALNSPIIRGWKYGVINGLPQYTKCYFRQRKFGQIRDMLEQRQYTKFYISNENESSDDDSKEFTTESVVTVKFVDAAGNITDPANTSSQNLSLEATSSVPYLDGQIRNRLPLSPLTQNSRIISLSANKFGQINL